MPSGSWALINMHFLSKFITGQNINWNGLKGKNCHILRILSMCISCISIIAFLAIILGNSVNTEQALFTKTFITEILIA